MTQPVGLKPQTADEEAVRVELELLANGGCDQMAFLNSMRQRFQFAPDGTWEVLAQLDQYYRRGKIKADMFQAIKSALAESALGPGRGGVPRVAAPSPPADVVARVTAPAPPGDEVPRDTAPASLGEARHSARESPAPAAPGLKTGDRLRDRYRIEGVVGQGGMGTVFEAVDDFRVAAPPSGQRLAIKVLHTAVTKRAELFAELRREFQNLQLLSHPNIVRVYEFDRDGPLAFFTMELLNGALLSRVLLARKPLRMEYAHSLAVIRDVGAAIGHAHSRGVVHGDINPQNIFITGPGDLRVLDFGASNRLNVEPAVPDERLKPIRFATPGYASCQVLEGKHPDVRDDVFALACVAYRLLCGEHPFSESSAVDARAAGSSPRKPEKLSYRQWRVLQEGLHWDREMRPGDVQNWLERLDLRGAARSLPPLIELLKQLPAEKRDSIVPGLKILPAALGLVLLVALAGGYWFARTPNATSRVAVTAPDTTQPPAAAHEPPPAANAAPMRLADSRPAASNAATPLRSVAPASVPPAPTAGAAPVSTATAAPVSTATAAPVPTATAAPVSTATAAPAQSARPALIEMNASTVEVPAGEDSARVEVRRKGNLRGDVSFTWWTESGTAKPATDFSPVVPQVAHIGDQQSRASLSIPLINSPRAGAKSFFVVIDLADGNAKLGDRALTMITLLPTS